MCVKFRAAELLRLFSGFFSLSGSKVWVQFRVTFSIVYKDSSVAKFSHELLFKEMSV